MSSTSRKTIIGSSALALYDASSVLIVWLISNDSRFPSMLSCLVVITMSCFVIQLLAVNVNEVVEDVGKSMMLVVVVILVTLTSTMTFLIGSVRSVIEYANVSPSFFVSLKRCHSYASHVSVAPATSSFVIAVSSLCLRTLSCRCRCPRCR